MKPHVFLLRTVIAAVVLAWMLANAHADERGSRPNVIIVITDDQGYGDVGAHGNEMIRTPTLDRLFAQSVRLTNFHVDPTCAPTRSALMTGRYSGRVGVWHTIMGRSLLRRNETTMADVFGNSGYRTGIFGKWHLGDNYPYRPQDRGFDEVLIHGGGGVGQTPDYWGNDYFDDTYWHNGEPKKYKGYCTDVWFDGAMKFIEANQDQPFFCYLATNAPHGPYLVADRYSKPYREFPDVPNANFYGMITNIDDNMDRLLKHLDRLQIANNTILIFMTDNGTAAGFRGNKGFNAGMRGTKGSEYDGGHRVPCFIRWPAGKLGKPRDIGHLSAHIDLLPTLIELCDLTRPESVKFDGSSLAPLLCGITAKWSERTLLVESQRIEHPEKWRKCAVMTQRWRLVNGKELYDITDDPGQKTDLSREHPEVVKKLRASYDSWWSDVSQHHDEYCEIVLGSEHEPVSRLTGHDWHAPQSNIPWNQGHLRNLKFSGNGFWAVEVLRAGKYEFVLCRQPIEAECPLDATHARIKIGELDHTQQVNPKASSTTITCMLPPGQSRLQTWLTDVETGNTRGAAIVYVRYLGKK